MNMYNVLTENKRLLFFFTACTWLFSRNLQQFLSKDFPFAASFRIKALNIFQLSNSIIINAPGSPRLVFLLLLTRSSSWEVWTWEKWWLYGNMFHPSSSWHKGTCLFPTLLSLLPHDLTPLKKHWFCVQPGSRADQHRHHLFNLNMKIVLWNIYISKGQ